MRAIRTSYTRGKNDYNDWYRCPNCGFVIQLSKTSTPDIAYPKVEDAYVRSDPGDPNHPENTLCTLENTEIPGGVCGYLSDGITAIDVYYTPRVYLPEQGCPFCGRVNLK